MSPKLAHRVNFRGAQLLGRFRSEADINSFEAERSMIRRVSTAVMIRVSGRQHLEMTAPAQRPFLLGPFSFPSQNPTVRLRPWFRKRNR
jgi:hypothetical protein